MRSMVDAVWVCAVLLVGLLCGAARAAEAVKIEKAKVKVEYKTFDPKHLPDPPPPVEKGESAVTVYGFGVETDLQYTYGETPRGGGGGPVTMDFRMERVTLKLSMTITVWLPEGANEQLKAHEEGHRQIAEIFYADADKAA